MTAHKFALQAVALFAAALALTAETVTAPVPASAPPPAPVVGLIDEVQELFPDTALEHPVRQLGVHAARGTIAGVHVFITGLRPDETVRFAESGADGQPTPNLRWYRLIDVPVAENTGLDRNTEKYSGKINPHVVRRAPFRVYDPIQPAESPFTAAASSLALRLEVPVDADATPGPQTHHIRVEVGGHMESLEFRVTAHRALVPPAARSAFTYINWHSIDNLCRAHGVEKWSEPFWAMLGNYARLLARERQNAFWFSWADYFTLDRDGNVTEFRRDRLERTIRLFLDAGFTTIHGAPLFGRPDWTRTDMLLYVPAGDEPTTDAIAPRAQHMLTQMAERVVAMMHENHWEGAWVQGLFDEPEDPFIERYRVLIGVLRRVKPDIRIVEATLTLNATGLVNIWCPQVHEYQAHRDFFTGRQAAGDRVWVYTCLSPGGPWMNRLLDQERLRQVYLAWGCAKFGIQGYLHWGGNFHTAKPFEELVRFHMEGQYLPAGDSHVIYPVREGPLSCHRLEAHRIGLEDYELLSQLLARNPTRAQEIIALVVQGFDQFAKDVSAYRAAKLQLLEAVDATTGR